MLFIGPEGIREWGCKSPSLGVDDPAWVRIKEFSGLDDETLAEVNDYIGLYREELRLDATRGKYGEVWKLVVAVKEAEIQTLQALKQLNSNPEFLDALALGLDGQDVIPSEALDKIGHHLQLRQTEKEKEIAFYENALKRLRHNERSGGWQSLLTLVSWLNNLLREHTGHRIHQSFKPPKTGERNSYHYVLEVCKFANPNLSESYITDAIKQIVKQDNEEGEDDDQETDQKVRRKKPSRKKPRRPLEWDLGTWEKMLPNRKEPQKYTVQNSKLGIRARVESQKGSLRCSITATGNGGDKSKKMKIILPPIPAE